MKLEMLLLLQPQLSRFLKKNIDWLTRHEKLCKSKKIIICS